MTASTSYLFVYGTLLDKQNEFGAYLQANCTFYADGKFKGRLYDIGEYPGATLNSDGSYVYGKIHIINNPGEIFPVLDNYEGYGPGQPQPNEFIRNFIKVETTNSTQMCWIYLYNLPTDSLPIIPNGKYLNTKHQT